MKSPSRSPIEKNREQFARQAIPFSKVPGHFDALDLLLETAASGPEDSVLDVACGPGIVACRFAETCAHVTGIDVTPEMIGQAKQRQKTSGLANLDWVTGTVQPLPFADASFNIVVCRYAFHHFEEPEAVLMEMVRVLKPAGRIVVADPVLPREKISAFNNMERRRDPSHQAALAEDAADSLFRETGLQDIRKQAYAVEVELEAQLKASFPEPGDEAIVRSMVTDDIGCNALGINAHARDGSIRYSYPIIVYSGRK